MPPPISPRWPKSASQRVSRGAAHALVLGALAIGAAGMAPGCSLLVTTRQCSIDADCPARGAAFAVTVCKDGVCLVPPAGSASGDCGTNADCASAGARQICRAADRRCVSLVSPPCDRVFGDAMDDRAILFGSMLDRSDAAADVIAGMELAFAEITHAIGGLPGGEGAKARPLAVVECDDRTATEDAAHHLIDTLGVPAIIGGGSSESTRALVRLAIPAGVMVISPAATGASLSTLDDEALVWRTTASNELQGRVMAALASDVEETLRAAHVTMTRALLVAKSDGFGVDIGDAIEASLTLNGQSAAANRAAGAFARVPYPTPASPETIDAVAGPILEDAPQLVFLASGKEGGAILAAVERGWAAAVGPTAPRPYYIVADAASGSLRFDPPDAGGDDPARRVRGTWPGRTASRVFADFAGRYATAQAGGHAERGAANAYDAVYTLLYAAAAVGNHRITGRTLAAAMPRLLPPAASAIDVGPGAISNALTTLGNGAGIDLAGASSPLDFDANGDVVTDVAVFCLTRDALGNVAPAITPQRYAVRAWPLPGEMEGTFACP